MRKLIILIALSIVSLTSIIGITLAAFQFNRAAAIDNIKAGDIGLPTISLYNVLTKSGNTALTREVIDFNTPGYNASSGVLKCYASEKKSYDDENEVLVELNNLEATISYTSKIRTKVRVKIQDQWDSYKAYPSGTIKDEIMIKDISANPFSFSTANGTWNYDPSTGYATLDGVLPAGEVSLDFLNCSNYHYNLGAGNISYRETIYVSLIFQIDIIQSNKDFDSLTD